MFSPSTYNFDYDDNGFEDVVISYKSNVSNNYWRIICYSQTGSILEEFFQENNENEFFQKGYILRNNDIAYLLATFIYRSGIFIILECRISKVMVSK